LLENSAFGFDSPVGNEMFDELSLIEDIFLAGRVALAWFPEVGPWEGVMSSWRRVGERKVVDRQSQIGGISDFRNGYGSWTSEI
jgi:hypothetical protein